MQAPRPGNHVDGDHSAQRIQLDVRGHARELLIVEDGK
jgi:hypothetical protein